jgi:hypothetical protein
MPTFCPKKASAVKDKYSQHGDDPQPINIMPSRFNELTSRQFGGMLTFFGNPAPDNSDKHRESH